MVEMLLVLGLFQVPDFPLRLTHVERLEGSNIFKRPPGSILASLLCGSTAKGRHEHLLAQVVASIIVACTLHMVLCIQLELVSE